MDIIINGTSKPVKDGDFNYSNMETSYKANTQFFTKNGEPFVPISGELHFSRVPTYRWKSTLLKMKALGINTVSTYIFWNHHEDENCNYDFSGNKDIAKFLTLCRQVEMPCILRIGPWCHGEVIRGGFPERIDIMKGKRSDDEEYLREVKKYWIRLYKEVEPFLDEETVIAIQIENEYTGKLQHLKTLRKLAEEIGFKAPFFTMTAWPSGDIDRDFLPMMGGYPDAPWNRGKKRVKPNNRFAISLAKTEDEIGADLHKNNTNNESGYDYIPYACCEIGPGNQVTQHRRPYIWEKDGYGVGFAKFASGANWLGYYMFCGGFNPNDRLLQENTKTGYPNNYQIIDYDFQAPVGRYGDVRDHGQLLKHMHLFITDFDNEICKKQAFFPEWKTNKPDDISFLKCSIRSDENARGYFFSSTYEKGLSYNDFNNVNVHFTVGKKKVDLPKINIKAGSMFFYPFNINIENIDFDYILAQPILKTQEGEETVCYFKECEGIKPRYSVNGKETDLKIGKDGNIINGLKLIVLSQEEAKKLYYFGGKVYFLDGTVYYDGENVVTESVESTDLSGSISLKECDKQELPYDEYIYSTGKRVYYEMKIPKNILENRYDVRLEFDFDGLNLQIFAGGKIVNDYFNIDRKFIMNLRDYKEYIERGDSFIIRTVPKTRLGISKVYNEIQIPFHSHKLVLNKANALTETLINTK